MNKRPISVPLGIILCLVVVVMLVSCGGSSDDGQLLISGNIANSNTRMLQNLRDGLAGYTVSALGDKDVTDSGGNFQIFGNSSVPPQTLLTIESPDGTTTDFVIDTSGTTPFIINFAVDSNGALVVSSSESAGGGDGSSLSTPVPEVPTVVGTVFPTSIPDDNGGFSESADCFCNDGFGPVAPSFVCADTGKHPTNCVEPTPSAT